MAHADEARAAAQGDHTPLERSRTLQSMDSIMGEVRRRAKAKSRRKTTRSSTTDRSSRKRRAKTGSSSEDTEDSSRVATDYFAESSGGSSISAHSDRSGTSDEDRDDDDEDDDEDEYEYGTGLSFRPRKVKKPEPCFVVPFRVAVTVPFVLAILFASGSIGLPLSIFFLQAYRSMLQTHSSAMENQTEMLNQLVASTDECQFGQMLQRIDWSIRTQILFPTDRALDSFWNDLRLMQRLGTTGAQFSSEAANILPYAAWMELTSQQANGISGHSNSLFVIFSSGAMYGASLATNDTTTAYTFASTQEDPHQIKGYRVDQENMAQKGTQAETTFFYNGTSRPPYMVQQRLAQQGGPERETWTQLYPFQAPWNKSALHSWNASVGLTLTRPVTYCGDYSCFDGVVGADIDLNDATEACTNEWNFLQSNMSAHFGSHIGPENSTIFIVTSYFPLFSEQEGVLVGASHAGLLHTSESMPLANESSVLPVQETSKAVLLKYGAWNSPELSSNTSFRFCRKSLSEGRFEDCTDLAPSECGCMEVAHHSVKLKGDLRWLLVASMPADAFTKRLRARRDEIEEQVLEQQRDAWRRFYGSIAWASVITVSMTAVSLCLGLLLARWVARPLKRLRRQMHRLGNLDLSQKFQSINAEPSRRLAIAEIEELDSGFWRLWGSIEAFARFVPESVVRNIISGDSKARRLHVEHRTVTIMFSDVKDFTTIAENLSPTDLILTLYMYLSRMTRIVESTEGVVSEILGDGLLVFWNTPSDVEDHAGKACWAALAQLQALRPLNHDLAGLNLPQLSIRIGLHTGDVLSGNIGSEMKMKFGCLGDTINLASRLEGLAKYYGVSAICSGATRDALPAHTFEVKRLDLVQVKGKKEPVWVYELLGAAAPPTSAELAMGQDPRLDGHTASTAPLVDKMPLTAVLPQRLAEARRYESGLEAFHEEKLAAAASAMESLLVECPQDVAARRLLERCRRAADARRSSSSSFSPVLAMTDK